MRGTTQEALRTTAELNASYHTPGEIYDLISKLTGKPVDESFRMFPPFYTDCGKTITIGKDVFINSGCHFQDQGGIRIGDGALIGHCVVLATLNHAFVPDKRQDIHPASIVIGKNVWIGSNATVIPEPIYLLLAAILLFSCLTACGSSIFRIPSEILFCTVPATYRYSS